MMAARVELREISNEEGNRLLRIVRRGGGSVVTWRRAQIVLLAAQGMSPTRISEVVFTDPDTVRELIHNFNGDGFDALYPRYRGGRPQTFTLPQRQQIKKIALSVPTDLGQPFATWSLAKLADYVVAEGVVTDISHEGLRKLLHEEGVRFQALRTWKRSNDPHFEAKKNRILELYALAEAGAAVVICLDEFGPLNLQPQPGGKAWAPRAKPRRIRATPAHTASATSSPPTTSAATASTGTSRGARAGSSSSPSAATSARSIRPPRGSTSCSTTSARTWARRCAPGRTPTTSSSPTRPSTPPG
jgi:transposase